LAVDESFATLEMKVSFLRPVWRSALTATAHVVHRGKTTGLVECRVTDERDRLIAHATSTCLVLRGSQASGRGLGDTGAG
ncbi:MAG TPA: PaaI family thioesterase, partial [Gemmatimonadaceae bacterium]|nr:PaaI family thioesterase [Gemmatimonadaceae bacterium]